MTFYEARQLLRDIGYTVTKGPDRVPGVTEYMVWRIDADENGIPTCHRWLLTADDIKAGVFRAQSLAQQSN
jgi:hypothetical protein